MAATVWNSADKAAAISLSTTTESNDTLTGSGGSWASARATTSATSGKLYFEIKVIATAGLASGGIAKSDMTLANYPGATSTSCGLTTTAGAGNNFASGMTLVGNVPPGYSANDIMNVAADLTAGKLWYGKNNSWLASGNPSAGTNAYVTFTGSNAYFPVGGANGSGESLLLKTITADLAYAPPSGFSPWAATATLFTASPLSYTFSLVAANIGKSYKVVASTISYSFTLVAASFPIARKVIATPIAYSFSLVAATTKFARRMTALPLSYAFSLVSATVAVARKLTASPLSFTFSLVSLIELDVIAPSTLLRKAKFVLQKLRNTAPTLGD